MTEPLTVIIPCKNERENIGACVASARQVADEVLLADSGSTDGTLELAAQLGCRIIEREYGTSGDFKNWAIPQAKHEWVFILDADERITPRLAAEIRGTLSATGGPSHYGYWVVRRNHFMGHPIRFGPWKNDRCLRLFHRDLGRYVGPTDHAEVELSSGTVGTLSQRLTHYTCDSYAQYLPKIHRYADVQARLWQAAGREPKLRHLLFRFPLRFLQGYLLRLGFLDGFAGVQVCVLVAYLSWLKQAYLWQLQRGRNWREQDRLEYPIALPVPRVELQCDDANSNPIEQEPNALGAEPPLATARKRSWREWRRAWTPAWLQTDARRLWRNNLFRQIGIQRCYAPPLLIRQPELAVRSHLPFVVANELSGQQSLTFLQVGAYDGIEDDDLRDLILRHKLRGVLVEPQPAAFSRLQHTYRNQPNVSLLQAAIAETEGTRELFCKRGEPSMAASFVRSHLRKHGISENDIETCAVACHTVHSALAAAGLSHVDLLQIDAEGYDGRIIQSIDFSRLQPRIIRFEYRNLPPNEADDCLALLATQGYQFIAEARDMIAVRTAASRLKQAPPQRRSA
ncbi:MAG: FkbM family methyltransferase [Pirellulales bacterium]|nr:FkbM family methyltransferase [Pirellulales bacterium]